MSSEFEIIKQQVTDEAIHQKHRRRVEALRGAYLKIAQAKKVILEQENLIKCAEHGSWAGLVSSWEEDAIIDEIS